MTWSSLYINFSNDYYPSRDRYDPVRWEEERCFIMKTLPDSLTDRHSVMVFKESNLTQRTGRCISPGMEMISPLRGISASISPLEE